MTYEVDYPEIVLAYIGLRRKMTCIKQILRRYNDDINISNQ